MRITTDGAIYSPKWEKNFARHEAVPPFNFVLRSESFSMRRIRVSSGEESEEFGQALLEHLNALYGFAMVLARDQAEDLVQETYLRALQSANHFEIGSNLKAWLFTILRNIWINQQRARRASEAVDFIDLENKAAAAYWRVVEESPDALLARKLQRREVRAAIENLPVIYSEVVILRDLEGFSYREITQILGCPLGTVMSRLGRARAALRQILSKPVKPANKNHEG